jgi:hypothetical protein
VSWRLFCCEKVGAAALANFSKQTKKLDLAKSLERIVVRKWLQAWWRHDSQQNDTQHNDI